jgi:hypothetical protein
MTKTEFTELTRWSTRESFPCLVRWLDPGNLPGWTPSEALKDISTVPVELVGYIAEIREDEVVLAMGRNGGDYLCVLVVPYALITSVEMLQ